MTAEERKKLCEWLRDPSVYDIASKCSEAADEIERLETGLRVAQVIVAEIEEKATRMLALRMAEIGLSGDD